MRQSKYDRETKETKIFAELILDGDGNSKINTGIEFFDHMLTLMSKQAFIDLNIDASGDIGVDSHHLVEDTGIVIGNCLKNALGNKDGIKRYGSFLLPMEETLVICAIDFSGRPLLCFDANFTTDKLGMLDTENIEEFFRAIANNCGINIHIKLMYGKNNHHISEAIFKAFGKCIDQAKTIDPRIKGVFSTKGML